MTVASRDFYEKGFTFHNEGKVYRYTVAIVDSEDKIPCPKDTVRADTMINCGIMQRDENDNNKVKFSVIT
jgi:hypothetical protein